MHDEKMISWIKPSPCLEWQEKKEMDIFMYSKNKKIGLWTLATTLGMSFHLADYTKAETHSEGVQPKEQSVVPESSTTKKPPTHNTNQTPNMSMSGSQIQKDSPGAGGESNSENNPGNNNPTKTNPHNLAQGLSGKKIDATIQALSDPNVSKEKKEQLKKDFKAETGFDLNDYDKDKGTLEVGYGKEKYALEVDTDTKTLKKLDIKNLKDGAWQCQMKKCQSGTLLVHMSGVPNLVQYTAGNPGVMTLVPAAGQHGMTTPVWEQEQKKEGEKNQPSVAGNNNQALPSKEKNEDKIPAKRVSNPPQQSKGGAIAAEKTPDTATSIPTTIALSAAMATIAGISLFLFRRRRNAITSRKQG